MKPMTLISRLFSGLMGLTLWAVPTCWGAEAPAQVNPATPGWAESMTAAYAEAHANTKPPVELGPWLMSPPYTVEAFDENPLSPGAPDLKAVVGGKPLWQPWTQPDGKAHALTLKDSQSVYFVRKITATRDFSLPISLGSDDGLEVWLDQELVHQNDANRAVAPDQDPVTLTLTRGEHWLLIKVYNGAGLSGFYFKVGSTAIDFAAATWQQYRQQSEWFQEDNPRRLDTKIDADDFVGDIEAYLQHQGTELEQALIRKVFEEMENGPGALAAELEALVQAKAGPEHPGWLRLYEKACRQARTMSWPERMAKAYAAANGRGNNSPYQFGPWSVSQGFKVKKFADNPLSPKPPQLDAKQDGKALWSPWEKADGQVQDLSLGNNESVYFVRKIVVKQACKLPIGLGSDDGIEAWLDDQRILSHDAVRPAHPDQEKLTLDLVPGDHWLLVKVFNLSGNSGFFFGTGKVDNTLADKVRQEFPHQSDWFMQDCVRRDSPAVDADDFDGDIRHYLVHQGTQLEETMVNRVLKELAPATAAPLAQELKALSGQKAGTENPAWLALYEKACRLRRAERLKPLLAKTDKVIFAKHQVFASQSGIYVITETEGCPAPSSLCQIDLKAETPEQFAPHSILFDAKAGIARDPELSFDAQKLLFAWRQTRKHINTTNVGNEAPKTGNYQVYEMDLASRKIRQLTKDDTYGASFEPCYLPNGDILFSSARIVQHITCGWGDCSNLFIMNKDGKYARRIGFDQTNTDFPSLMSDGRVIFTRRDYNDRGQSSAHALFVMNADGTGQTEMYGNQTGTPNSFHHARGIPGSHKILTIIGGYHTTQGGKLAVMDVNQGREKDQGLLQIPDQKKPDCGDGYNDSYGKQGVQYSNPWPFSETEFLVSRSSVANRGYGVFFMNADGRRELLAADRDISCLQPVPLMARPRPAIRPSQVDYRKDSGIIFMQDAYQGVASQGIPRGAIKRIRVVEILYKPCTIGWGMGAGPGGARHTVTNPGHPIGPFDAKRILGDATVYEDGSAMFRIPARVPIYFQLLDDKNRVLQTMRSWATLMPNENFSCVGCHEDKTMAPDQTLSRRTQAMRAGIEELKPFYGPPRGFSYPTEVQPVFDKHCVSCHNPYGKAKKLVLTSRPLIDDPDAKKQWMPSYYNLTKARPGPKPEDFALYGTIWAREGKAKEDEPNHYLKWWTRFELMKPYPPMRAGSITSPLIQMLEKGHQNVKLSQEEWDKLCAWIDMNIPYCGAYNESNTWSPKERAWFQHRMEERARNEKIDRTNIREFIKDGQP